MREHFDPHATAFLKIITSLPGVYSMYYENNAVIYVGKAKDLKNVFPAISVATSPVVNGSVSEGDSLDLYDNYAYRNRSAVA
ncbi:MAG: hypothetical protein ACSLEM_03095 [Candidatus Malihini olakiniferum]